MRKIWQKHSEPEGVAKLKFLIKQGIKLISQYVFLPVLYFLFCVQKVDKDLVLFADAHHDELPDAMKEIYRAVADKNKTIHLHCLDYGKAYMLQVLGAMVRFTREYSKASVVFICDYYLPANSCRKRPQTQLIELWHACGILKKFGYDAEDDIPSFYKGKPLKNVTMTTVSAPCCIPIYANAMGLDEKNIIPTGISRTDRYFTDVFNERCRNQFYQQYPQAMGKKILIWAPTFRGNAGMPSVEGVEDILTLEEQLGEDWFVIRKFHPHMEEKVEKSNCSILTEELLPVCDVLITDYSTIMYDYMFYGKPLILFVPDLDTYVKRRGFYLDYKEIPAPVIRDSAKLTEAVLHACVNRQEYDAFIHKYLIACDGHATERIMNLVF